MTDILVFQSELSCTEHSELFNFFCVSCDCLICSDCVLSNHNGHMFSSVDETVRPARNAVSDYISHTKENMTKIEVSRKHIENDYMLKLNLCTEQQLSDIEGIATTLHGIVDMVKDMHARQINDYKGIERRRLETFLNTLDAQYETYNNLSNKFENILSETHDITFLNSYTTNKQNLVQSHDDIPELPLPREIKAVTPDDVIDDVLKQIDSQYPTSNLDIIVKDTESPQSSRPESPTRTPDENDTNRWNKLLFFSARDDNIERIELALKNGADVNWPMESYLNGINEYTAYYTWNGSPLHIATMYGHVECVRALIKHKANLHCFDNQGQMPVHAAAAFGETDCLKALLDNGATVADRTEWDETPLHVTAGSGTIRCMEELISRGADVKPVSKSGNMPIHEAVRSGNTDCVRVLVEHGATVMDRTDMEETPLHVAMRSDCFDRKGECLYQLLALGSLVDAKDKDGISPMDIAVEYGNLYWIRLMKLHTVKVDETNKEKKKKAGLFSKFKN